MYSMRVMTYCSFLSLYVTKEIICWCRVIMSLLTSSPRVYILIPFLNLFFIFIYFRNLSSHVWIKWSNYFKNSVATSWTWWCSRNKAAYLHQLTRLSQWNNHLRNKIISNSQKEIKIWQKIRKRNKNHRRRRTLRMSIFNLNWMMKSSTDATKKLRKILLPFDGRCNSPSLFLRP